MFNTHKTLHHVHIQINSLGSDAAIHHRIHLSNTNRIKAQEPLLASQDFRQKTHHFISSSGPSKSLVSLKPHHNYAAAAPISSYKIFCVRFGMHY